MKTLSQEVRNLTGKGGRYTSVFEAYVETTKSVQDVGRILTVETAVELARLRAESPRATGLLAKSWKGFTTATKDKTVNDISDALPIPKPAKKIPPEKLNMEDVYPEWFDEYYATGKRGNKQDRAIANVATVLLIAVATLLSPLALLYWLYKKIRGLRLIARKFVLKLCRKVTAITKKLTKVVAPNRIRLYIRINNTAPNSYFRIVGRAAGKMPPVKKLENWAVKRGLPKAMGYVIAKKISEQGTERYRTGQNVVGINPTTQNYRSDAGLVRLVNRVLAYL